MSTLRTQKTGRADQILVVELPDKLVDETTGIVRETATTRLPNCERAALILDCRNVSLINSIGITCLLQLQDHCRQHQAGFMLAGIPESIRTFLAQLRLDERFEQIDTVEDAIAECER